MEITQNTDQNQNPLGEYARKTSFLRTDLGCATILGLNGLAAGALFYLGYNYSDFSEPPFVVFPGAVALATFGALSAVIDKRIRSKAPKPRQTPLHEQTLEHAVDEQEPITQPLTTSVIHKPVPSYQEPQDPRRCYIEYD